MGNCAIRAAAAVLGLLGLVSCHSTLPTVPVQQDPNRSSNLVTVQLFAYDDMQAKLFERYRGRLFLLHYDPAHPDDLQWVFDCNPAATYTYAPASNPVENTLDFDNESQIQASLGITLASFRGFLHHGSKLHLRYRVSGSWAVEPGVKIPIACKAAGANYYVQIFDVGAYAIDSMGADEGAADVTAYGQEGGGSADSASRGNSVGGDLAKCNGTSAEPLASCSAPLKILVVPITEKQWAEDAPTSSDPDPTPHPPRPTPTTNPPRSPDRPAEPQVHAVTDVHSPLHKQCYDGLSLTGDAMRDLSQMSERCGRRLGLVPVGNPISNHQAGADPEQKFTVHLEGGACYRLFGNADGTVDDLDTKLIDDTDRSIVTQDQANDNHPVLDPDGPFCVTHTGTYSLIVSVIRGDGRYAVQLWKMPRHD